MIIIIFEASSSSYCDSLSSFFWTLESECLGGRRGGIPGQGKRVVSSSFFSPSSSSSPSKIYKILDLASFSFLNLYLSIKITLHSRNINEWGREWLVESYLQILKRKWSKGNWDIWFYLRSRSISITEQISSLPSSNLPKVSNRRGRKVLNHDLISSLALSLTSRNIFWDS